MTPQAFRELLAQQILVIDGAMGTMIQSYAFGPEAYGGEAFQMLSDLLTFSKPEAIQEIHLKYYQAGANAVETNSFGASPLRLAEFDITGLDLAGFPADCQDITGLSLEQFTRRLNQKAGQNARAALEQYQASPEYDGRPLLVLGSIGPSNWVLSPTHADLHKGSFEQIEANFYEQVMGLIAGGVDVLLFETQQDALELKAAVLGAKRAMAETGTSLPIICQVTVDQHCRMQIFNTDILAAYVALAPLGIDAFGINCSIGPDLMRPTVEKLSRHAQLPLSIIPNAGLPYSENGRTLFKLTPEEMAQHVGQFVEELGVNIVGGCCGTTPGHIQAVAQRVKGLKPKIRKPQTGVWVAGPQNAVALDSSKGLIRIGERLNVRGSKKVRDAVESGGPIDQDALEEVVSEQVRDLGIEIIDVCMDSNQVDTPSTLAQVIQAQTVDFPVAMCLDSFDVKALEKAIQVYPGRPVINSLSLEEVEPGLDKIDAVLQATVQHGPLYIALTTGPKGPAVTREEKLELARAILDKAMANYPVQANQFLVDINAFPIGSESEEGMNFALESLKAIRPIKEAYPGVMVTIGVGNLTNGLAKKPYMRKVLTSVFLDEGLKEGLDAAIVNPSHFVPVASLPPADYALGLRVVLERDMEAFAQLEEIAAAKAGGPVVKKTSYEDLSPTQAVAAKIKDGYKERKEGSLEYLGQTYQYHDLIVPQVAGILESGMTPLELINDHLMVAMEELGSGFAEGSVSLPHLLKAADVMKQVMGFLEATIKVAAGGQAGGKLEAKGCIVLGTVYQDVHSIGKDLTKTLLENYGYKVVDLGVQVPLQDFVAAAKEHRADAIGMSALLVQTSNHMITVSALAKEQGLGDLPILIGGAPVNQRHAAYVDLAGQEAGQELAGNVFFCQSAMDGVNVMSQICDPTRKAEALEKNRQRVQRSLEQSQRLNEKQDDLLAKLPLRQVDLAQAHPAVTALAPAMSFGSRLQDFKSKLNLKNLYALNWRYGGKSGREKKGISDEQLQAQLDKLVERCDFKGWITPKGLYQLFPCRTEGNQVVILDPKSNQEVGRLNFNELVGEGEKDKFSVAQYFSPQADVIGLQISTAGKASQAAVEALKDSEGEESWLLQGLADRVAEDVAEVMNQELEKLVWGGGQGKSCRYSPGYPAMLDHANNRVIHGLLKAQEKLGISLTEGDQFSPTATTAAVVCFHRQASYK